MSKIFVTVRCYCCGQIDKIDGVKKPTMAGAVSIENTCSKCGSVHTYRIKRKSIQDLEVITTAVQTTEEGARLYKEAKGEDIKIKST